MVSAAVSPDYYKVGNFWTNRQRQAHSLNEISYRACFKPQLPEYFIDRFTNTGDIVLDPFMGRGTTVIQAALSKRVAYSSDINPLAKMLVLPRLDPPSLESIEKRFKQIPSSRDIPHDDKSLSTFFHSKTLQQLLALKHWFIKHEKNDTLTPQDMWIRMIVLNRLTGHSKGFLSVRTMPPNQAVSIEKQRQINKKNNQTPEVKDVLSIVMKKTKSLLRSGLIPLSKNHKLDCCYADDLNYIDTDQVKLVVTSPPFLDVVDYAKDNWLRCWFAGIDINTIKIDQHRTVNTWRMFVRRVFEEFSRVVIKGGHVAFEVGEVRKGTIKLEDEVLKAVDDMPFKLVEIMINQQTFTKTSNCWGITNNTAGTLTNRIVVMKKV